MRHKGNTPSFGQTRDEILLGSIAEIGYLHLGGVDQWVMIRGENTANPLLICCMAGRARCSGIAKKLFAMEGLTMKRRSGRSACQTIPTD